METTYELAPDVNPDAIAADAQIFPGCRLSGADLSIGPGCIIGAEGPATVINCQLGKNVQLSGGYFENATFLDGFSAGNGAHVRPGCLFEEGASIAHTVGVKQTVFMPWVTSGSLVNFCDALMAGGTGRKNHSEIGSSYIHFNFTPRQDKATPSLIGDVPHGVLLCNDPIFLGGQGGLVGPRRLAYGTIIPAGQVWREDVLDPNRMVGQAARLERTSKPYDVRHFPDMTTVIKNNLTYIGNLLALDTWYRGVRQFFMQDDRFQQACYRGALQRLSEMFKERVTRLEDLATKIAESTNPEKNSEFLEQWPSLLKSIQDALATRESVLIPSEVACIVEALPKENYLKAIQSLNDVDREIFALWLQWRVDTVMRFKRGSCC